MMYVVKHQYGLFGPFKTLRVAQKWKDEKDKEMGLTGSIRVLNEADAWELIRKETSANGTQQTAPAGNSPEAPPSSKKP